MAGSVARRARLLRERIAQIDSQAARLASLRAFFAAKLAWLEAGEVGPAPRVEPASSPPRRTSRRK